MRAEGSAPKVVAIVGATASGKSAAAALVAGAFGGEVINADSRLFYLGMDIGTAKPSAIELQAVPHHLVSFLEPTETYNLSSFLDDANRIVRDIHQRGGLTVLAGGTGQYVWGLIEGWQVPQIPPDPDLRKKLEAELESRGVQSLFSRLQDEAPEIAETIDGENPRRVIRALERVASGGAGEHRRAVDPGYESLVVGLHVERSELHRRIAERVDHMLAAGWVDEVRQLTADGVDFASPALSAIGYREIASFLKDEMSLDDARERTIRATNRLVRHQNNWFKQSDERIHWIDVTDGVLTRVSDIVGGWLGRSDVKDQESR